MEFTLLSRMVTQLKPHAAQFARGVVVGCGAVTLAGVNAKAGIAASKIKDFNGRPDTFEEKNTSDVYSGMAAILSTQAIMSLKEMPLARRVGLSIPIALASGILARWAYEKSGKLLKLW